MVTYPNFTFSYPDGWNVTEQNVDVTAGSRNDFKRSRSYSNIYAYRRNTGWTWCWICSVGSKSGSVEVGDSQFVPGYVQDTNYADLGTFGVMKLKQTGQIDIKAEMVSSRTSTDRLHMAYCRSRELEPMIPSTALIAVHSVFIIVDIFR